MSARITVKDLARLCGVSIGTVDRAINNRGGINPETAAKARAAGANVLVAGTSLFKAKDMCELNNALKG